MTHEWYDDRVGVSEVLEVLRLIARTHNVRIVLRRSMDGARWSPKRRTIYLGAICFVSQRYLISYFFHELAHSVNFDRKKFWHYHKCGRISKSHMRRIALKAERYTDKVGDQLMQVYFPDIPYLEIYDSKDSKKALYDLFELH